MKKRLGALALAVSLLAGAAAAGPAMAAENTPPVIHGLTDMEWPDNRLLPWREGVTVTDVEDGDITDKLTYNHMWQRSTRPGDPPTMAVYTYSVTDSGGATTTGERYFNMIPREQWRTDNKPPVLIAGGDTVTKCIGDTYDPLDHVRFDDDYDGKNIGMQQLPPGITFPDRLYPGISAPFSDTIMPGPYTFATEMEYRYRFADSDGALTPWITIWVTVVDCSPNPKPPAPTRGYFMNNHWGPVATLVYTFGRATDEVFVGDWDGNGTDTIALRRGNTFHINNGHDSTADYTIRYGRAGDTILVGDWDGDGVDTFAVRRGKTYHVKNRVTGGDADHVIHYGRAGDQVLVGDWNGDRKDTFAVRRGSVYHVKNRIAGGDADHVINYGRENDDVYVGDWDGDRKDTFTVRRGKTYYIANTIRGGAADEVLVYGRESDTTIVGDWDGDGVDTLGIRR